MYEVKVTLPWSTTGLLPEPLYDWLHDNVGPATDKYHFVGDDWKIKRVKATQSADCEHYWFEFVSLDHAVMFKLAWG